MCCCDKATVNGEYGYRWQPEDTPIIREVDPPSILPDDMLVFDLPGRCGGGSSRRNDIDAHSHHYRLVKNYGYSLLVRHGDGEERIRLSMTDALLDTLKQIDSDRRYYIFHAIYHAHNDGDREGKSGERARWSKAAAEKRIKTRKTRGWDSVKVWIVDAV